MPRGRRELGETDDTISVDELSQLEDSGAARASVRSSFLPTVSVLAGRYELSAMLGSGGMGTVFRAKDLELEELVALKVLNPELVDSVEALGRFKAEVKLARRVTHRNVARTFDFGTHGDLRFLTMEYVDGVSLDERIGAEPALTMNEILALTQAILRGLSAAHGAGVLHRDLKPANVMLGRDGRVLLMDFGIAHALESDERDRRTKNGLVGTPLYMSPEQVEGVRDLDGRSDLYSLGLMIHEMATREVPFDGPSPYSVAAARLLRPAPPLARADAPAWFRALTTRLLSTQRDDRPRDADTVLAEFAEPSSPSLAAQSVQAHLFVEPAQHTLRVGVITLASEERTLHVARALTEELAELLASSPRAQVLVGTALPGETPRDAGRRLGVDLVLEGQLTESDATFAVRLRLTTVAEGFLLFATRAKETLAALPRWIERTAASLAEALESKLDAPPRPPTDPTTLDLYFRGRAEFHKRWRESALLARDLLSQAYERAPDDPAVVSAYALLLTRMFGFAGEADSELAERMVARANALAPGRAEAMMASAAMAFQIGDFERTAHMLREVLARTPQHADALDLLGRILSEVGPAEEAVRVLQLAQLADPKQISVPLETARVAALLGDWSTAQKRLDELDRSDVPRALVAFSKHRVLKLWRGDRSADEELERVIQNPGAFTPTERATVQQFMMATREASPEVLRVLRQMLRAALHSGPRQKRRAAFNAQVRAEVLALHGLFDDSLTELEEANEHELFDELWMENVPVLAPLRGTERFERIRVQVAQRAAKMRALLPLASGR